MLKMLTGHNPFFDVNHKNVFKNVLNKEIDFDNVPSESGKDLISKLLVRDQSQRIGASKGAKEIMKHEYFSEINWEKFNNKQVKPPFVPSRDNLPTDKYVSKRFLGECAKDSLVVSELTTKEKNDNQFLMFTYSRHKRE